MGTIRWSDAKLLPKRLSAIAKTSDLDAATEVLLEYFNAMLFRGQSCASWPLQTRLHRTFADNTLANERRMLQVFRADAPALLGTFPGLPTNALEWFALMQHHGAPTRLLDWSHSPFIAAFFACESEPDADGGIWMLDRTWATAATLETVSHTNPDLRTWRGPVEPVVEEVLKNHSAAALPVSVTPRFARVAAQEGSFTLIGTPQADAVESIRQLGQAPKSSRDAGAPVIRKLEISRSLKPRIMTRLAAMRITHATVYPDIEGLARSLQHRDWLDWYQA